MVIYHLGVRIVFFLQERPCCGQQQWLKSKRRENASPRRRFYCPKKLPKQSTSTMENTKANVLNKRYLSMCSYRACFDAETWTSGLKGCRCTGTMINCFSIDPVLLDSCNATRMKCRAWRACEEWEVWGNLDVKPASTSPSSFFHCSFLTLTIIKCFISNYSLHY